MRVVGLDASITGTTMFDGERFVKVAPKTKDGDKVTTADYVRRFSSTREAVRRFVGLDPETVVFMEGFAPGKTNYAHEKGGLGWVLRMAIIDAGHQLWLLPPQHRAILGAGKNSAKNVVVSAVSARTGVAFDSDDHVDAYLMWVAGCEKFGLPHTFGELPQTHARALNALEEVAAGSVTL